MRAVRRRRRGRRDRLHANRPALLRRRRARGGAPRAGARRGRRLGPVGRAGDGLGAARLRADAVVGEGAGAPPPAVRRGRRGGDGRARRERRRARRRRAASTASRLLAANASARGSEDVAPLRRGLPPLLLAGGAIADLRLAPFHLLATEGEVHVDRDHVWHMETLGRLAAADPALLVATAYLEVDLTDRGSGGTAIAWWEELTDAGGEGMVVKPCEFIARGRRGLAQPALKMPRAASTSGSSTGRSTRRPTNRGALRRAVSGREAVARARGSSRSGSRRSSASCGASRSRGSTSASSASSRWRASQSTRGCSARLLPGFDDTPLDPLSERGSEAFDGRHASSATSRHAPLWNFWRRVSPRASC